MPFFEPSVSSAMSEVSGPTAVKTPSPSCQDVQCAYCGLERRQYLVYCAVETCRKWFCNGTRDYLNKSHIMAHCAKSKHTAVSILHGIPRSLSQRRSGSLDFLIKNYAYQPRCSKCQCPNVFDLGVEHIGNPFDATKTWCRKDAVQGDKVGKDLWHPLVALHPENDRTEFSFRRLAAWIVPVVPPSLMNELRRKSFVIWGLSRLDEHAVDMLEFWRWKPLGNRAESIQWERRLRGFTAAWAVEFATRRDYSTYWKALVTELSQQEQGAIEALPPLRNLTVTWDNSSDIKVVVPYGIVTEFLEQGRCIEVTWVIKSKDGEIAGWPRLAFIFDVIPRGSEHIIGVRCFEAVPERDMTRNLQFRIVYNGINYLRMQRAMDKLENDTLSVSPEVLGLLLGTPALQISRTTRREFRYFAFQHVLSPQQTRLNVSQHSAVRTALRSAVCLVRGPPGTGKTHTAAAIVANLLQDPDGKLLVCAPSNVAADNLILKIAAIVGARVEILRAIAMSRTNKYLHKDVLKYTVLGKFRARYPDEKADDETLRYFEEQCVERARIVCCTTNSSGLDSLAGVRFPYVLIDEAAQGLEPDCLIAITKGCEKLILIGDSAQLGPTVRFTNLQRSQLKSSLFARLWESERAPAVTLLQQYRMDPSISRMVSEITYGGQLVNDGCVYTGRSSCTALQRIFDCANRSAIAQPGPDCRVPGSSVMIFVDLARIDEVSSSGTSFVNMPEAHFIARLVANLVNSTPPTRDQLKPSDIGVITFYNGQRPQLEIDMKKHPQINDSQIEGIEINSVDGFQGREKRVIILSCVRSAGTCSGRRTMGFTDDRQRLNVAMSRAKRALIVVGNSNVFKDSDIWNQYFRYIPIVPMGQVCRAMSIGCSTSYSRPPCNLCPESYP